MSKIIQEGSLVNMKNRNVKGQGMVLKRVRDINEYAGFDLEEAFHKCYNVKSKDFLWKQMKSFSIMYHERMDLIQDINETITQREPNVEMGLLRAFWDYNSSYSITQLGKVKKVRKDFVMVKWFRAPSDHTSGSYKRFETGYHWVPSHLVGNCKISS